MLEILTPGFYTTIQDLGRKGFRKYGVPVSGAMDQASAMHANNLVGNAPSCAVLEITLIGPEIRFKQYARIAITGAICSCEIENTVVEMNSALEINEGQVLKIGNCSLGCRVYVAVKGGLDTEIVMGSRSQFKAITLKERIHQGDLLPIHPNRRKEQQLVKINPVTFSGTSLSVTPGPEFDLLPQHMQELLIESTFQILQDSNRIGYKLSRAEGLFAKEIITAPVQPGTVQLTPSGTLIILMRDAPVTGGYARVLQLDGEAIDRLAQMPIRHAINFSQDIRKTSAN